MLDPRDLLMGLLSVIATYFWYDKTRLDRRVDTLESKIDNQQDEIAEQKAKHDVLETKIDGLKELMNAQFELVLTAIREKQ